MSNSAGSAEPRDRQPSPIVYLNGEFIPLAQARVSVLDRGFMFADAVYEVIPVWRGKPFRADRHLQRLQNSLAAIALSLDYCVARWQAVFQQLLQRNQGMRDCSLYIQVTRGAGERDHCYQADLVPTVLVMCRPLPTTDFSQGVATVLHEDIRWQYCHIKSVALLPNVLLRQYARDQGGAREAILVRDGHITEGAASNVFIVEQGQVSTPLQDSRLLPGVTRALTLELVRELGLPCREEAIRVARLQAAAEIWLTGSITGIVPVIRLDGRPVGAGRPGPLWQQVNDAYQACKKRHAQETTPGGR